MESRGDCSFSGKGKALENCDHLNTPLAQVFYSQSAYQINSVKTINTGAQYHSENYKQGFHWDNMTEFVLTNINTDLVENPLIQIFNMIVDSYKRGTVSNFGCMELDYGKFNLSETASHSFGKSFEPEMLKFFNNCGSLMQTQGKWWNSGLLNGKLNQNILRQLPTSCPWQFWNFS